ncbi:MAG: hypothetical protein IJ358_00325 [Clostridia bacterium]|nr:hypothetical protein [Clostridia bacterium]
MAMKIKCRILSIAVVAVAAVASIVSAVKISRKTNDRVVYADSISFCGMIGGAEIYIDNELVVDDNLITITPSDCTVTPEFTIKKSGNSEEVEISESKYTFTSAGKYTLACKIKANENYYLKDTIALTVVDNPSTTTSMYIKQENKISLYVDDEIDLSSVAKTICPADATVEISCDENLSINNDIVTAINSGLGKIDVVLKFDNIVVCKTISIIIKPKIIENDIALRLTVGAKKIENDTIEIKHSKLSFTMAYELINIDNQFINCWVNDDVVKILNCNPMIIELLPLEIGETILYISPVGYDSIVFEIVIKII